MSINIDEIREDLQILSEPVYENEELIYSVYRKFEEYLRKNVKVEWNLDIALGVIAVHETRNKNFGEREKEKDKKNFDRAMTLFNMQMNKEDPGLGFSIITNSVADAATYTALGMIDAKKKEYARTSAAYKQLSSDLKKMSSSYVRYSIDSTIDEIVAIIENIEHDYQIWKENLSKNIGELMSEEHRFYNIDLNAIFRKIYCEKNFCIEESDESVDEYKNFLKEQGYLHGFPLYEERNTVGGRTYAKEIGFFYISTGKFENELLNKNVSNTDTNEDLYLRAEENLSKGMYYEAAILFSQCKEYKDATQRSICIWRDSLLTQGYGIIFSKIELDGTYNNTDNEFCNILCSNKADNVVLVDGTVFPVKDIEGCRTEILQEVKEWRNIVKVVHQDGAKGDSTFFVGVKNTGKLVATSNFKNYRPDISGWENIIDIKIGKDLIVALDSSGKVYVSVKRNPLNQDNIYEAAKEWKDVVRIEVNEDEIVALTREGRLLYIGNEDSTKVYCQIFCNVVDFDWNILLSVLTNEAKLYTEGNESYIDNVVGFSGNKAIKSDGTLVNCNEKFTPNCYLAKDFDVNTFDIKLKKEIETRYRELIAQKLEYEVEISKVSGRKKARIDELMKRVELKIESMQSRYLLEGENCVNRTEYDKKIAKNLRKKKVKFFAGIIVACAICVSVFVVYMKSIQMQKDNYLSFIDENFIDCAISNCCKESDRTENDIEMMHASLYYDLQDTTKPYEKCVRIKFLGEKNYYSYIETYELDGVRTEELKVITKEDEYSMGTMERSIIDEEKSNIRKYGYYKREGMDFINILYDIDLE